MNTSVSIGFVRPHRRLGLAVLVSMLLLGTASGTRGQSARPQTPSVFSNPTSIAPADRPNDQSPPGMPAAYPSMISVSGVAGVVSHITVTLNNVSHQYPRDLDVLLIGPTGARSILVSDGIDSNQLNSRNFTFDQSAPVAIPSDGGALSGTYRPANYAGLVSLEPGGVDNFPAPGPGSLNYNADLTVFNGTNPNGNWSLYVVDDETLDTGTIAGGWSIEISSQVVLASLAPNDYDGDHKSDLAVFRPTGGFWYILQSATNSFFGLQWGANGDTPVAGDFDGDGRTDVAVWRANGAGQPAAFLLLRSSTNTFIAQGWGLGGDDPTVCRDYDGDGKTDYAVYRPGSTSAFYVLRSSDNSFMAVTWGTAQDVPIPADYDGDGKADIAVYSVSRTIGNSVFYVLLSATNQFQATQFGVAGVDRVVTGDFDGDRKFDLAVWRTSGADAGSWYYIRSSDNVFRGVSFGTGATDTPIPADYDGDGKTDLAVYRPGAASVAYFLNSSDNAFRVIQWGTTGDIPATNYLVH